MRAGAIRGLVASREQWSFLHQLASAVSVACGAPYAVCVARLFPKVLEGQVIDSPASGTDWLLSLPF